MADIFIYVFDQKISDFGLARKMDIWIPKEGGKFPIKWTAPEALKESVRQVHLAL